MSARNPAARDFLRGRIEVLLTRQLQRGAQRMGMPGAAGAEDWSGRAACSLVSTMKLQAEVIERCKLWREADSLCARAGFLRAAWKRLGTFPFRLTFPAKTPPADRERYQTVYARERGSVAAPTAGLHFTPEILARMRERGIETAEVTLHVGLGTFQPVRSERVEEHQLHSEAYSISAEAAAKINRARSESRRIVAVGTTTVRTLEYAAQQGTGEIRAASGEAKLFIYPGYKFQVVQALLTNFHLPQSTLLMLVCALGGKENVMRAYEHAVAQRYRFYSYGDCMFVE